jgi:hypothetical protein
MDKNINSYSEEEGKIIDTDVPIPPVSGKMSSQ